MLAWASKAWLSIGLLVHYMQSHQIAFFNFVALLLGNLYWTNKVRKMIEVSRFDGSHRYVLIHENLNNPGKIVVDPVNG
jgi:hypothetical protein